MNQDRNKQTEEMKFGWTDAAWIVGIGIPGLVFLYLGLFVRGIRHRGWRDTFSFTGR